MALFKALRRTWNGAFGKALLQNFVELCICFKISDQSDFICKVRFQKFMSRRIWQPVNFEVSWNISP